MGRPGAVFVGLVIAVAIGSFTVQRGADASAPQEEARAPLAKVVVQTAAAVAHETAAHANVAAKAEPAPPVLDAPDEDAIGGTCDANRMPLPNRNLVEEAGSGGCPPGMARVESFCVDRYEASLAVVKGDGSLEPWSPYFRPRGQRVRALSIRNAVPQAYITGIQAAQACAEAGKRLCTDKEWLRACKGSQGTKYPYGPTRQSGACNDSRRTHPAFELFGTTDEWIWSELGHPCMNQLRDSLDRTSSNAECVTPEGVFDMMGNLHEWTADPSGTFRGGYYVDTRINGEGCDYVTTWHPRNHWDYSTGFRCCSDAEAPVLTRGSG